MTEKRLMIRSASRSQAQKKGWYPFRVLAVVFGITAFVLAVIIPNLSVQREEEDRLLQQASDAYWTAQSENNRLTQQVAESSTQDFVERVARRDFGYCVYGETVYTVSNLDEILAEEAGDPSEKTNSPDTSKDTGDGTQTESAADQPESGN